MRTRIDHNEDSIIERKTRRLTCYDERRAVRAVDLRRLHIEGEIEGRASRRRGDLGFGSTERSDGVCASARRRQEERRRPRDLACVVRHRQLKIQRRAKTFQLINDRRLHVDDPLAFRASVLNIRADERRDPASLPHVGTRVPDERHRSERVGKRHRRGQKRGTRRATNMCGIGVEGDRRRGRGSRNEVERDRRGVKSRERRGERGRARRWKRKRRLSGGVGGDRRDRSSSLTCLNHDPGQWIVVARSNHGYKNACAGGFGRSCRRRRSERQDALSGGARLLG